MTPVHADVMDRTKRRILRQQSAGLPEEVGELSFGHFSDRHRELAMRNDALAGYMPLNGTLYGGSVKTNDAFSPFSRFV